MSSRLVVAVLVVLPAVAHAQALTYSCSGDSSGDICGWAVSAAGDVNRDGYADYLVGVPGESTVRVYSGKTGGLIYSLVATGEMGRVVAPAGDVDGDLWADVFGGATNDSTSAPLAGAAFVFSGFDGSLKYTFLGESAGDHCGTGSGVGDLDADGFPDIAVGSAYSSLAGVEAGRVRAFSGKDGHVIWSLNGDAPGDLFGWQVASAGDANADGHPDVLVSIVWADVAGPNSGRVRVLSGPTGATLLDFDGEMQGVNATTFGYSISGGGDTNGDGYADQIIGVVHDDQPGPDSGSVRVYSGKNGSLLHLFAGDNQYEFLGWSVSGGTDVNADGYSDVVAGARYYPTLFGPGIARAYSGKDGTTLFTLSAGVVGDEYGLSVALVGDLDGNGRSDIVVGSYGDNNYFGKARVYESSGTCGSTSAFGSGCPGDGGFEPALGMTGCPASLGTVSLTISGAKSPTFALLVFGVTQGTTPMGGGCSLSVAPLLPLMLTLNVYGSGAGFGTVTATGQLPLTTYNGTITTQAFVADHGVPIGFAATNGVQFQLQ